MAKLSTLSNPDLLEHQLEAFNRNLRASLDGRSWDKSILPEVVIALLSADHYFNVHRPTDRIVLHPSYNTFLSAFGTFAGPLELCTLMARLQELPVDSAVSPEDSAALNRLITTWFQFQFRISDRNGNSLPVHPLLDGKTLTMRFLTEEEMRQADDLDDDVPFCATVREDGQLVRLPIEEPPAELAFP